MFTSVTKNMNSRASAEKHAAAEADPLKTGMIYLAVSILIAAVAAVYGLFSHGVYSYYMTYAFMIPLLGGAMPHLMRAMKNRTEDGEDNNLTERFFPADVQLAVIATLTAGSLLKGVLDIYGTTNGLLIVYPLLAVLIIAGALAVLLKKAENRK